MASAEGKPISHTVGSSRQGWNWKDHIFLPTLAAGVVGGAVGLASKHRKTRGLANISATYAANCSIVTASYCGAREFARSTRSTGPDDLISSGIGGVASGALLGRLQGGQIGAIKYSVIFAIAGTTIDFTHQQLQHHLHKDKSFPVEGENSSDKKSSWFKLPEWSPIQVLDEEALAAKRAREEQLYAQTTIGKLEKEC